MHVKVRQWQNQEGCLLLQQKQCPTKLSTMITSSNILTCHTDWKHFRKYSSKCCRSITMLFRLQAFNTVYNSFLILNLVKNHVHMIALYKLLHREREKKKKKKLYNFPMTYHKLLSEMNTVTWSFPNLNVYLFILGSSKIILLTSFFWNKSSFFRTN